jgi:hypothetical protein
MITEYTTYDTIRAVLGVSAKEAKDATLALPVFETQFLLEMSDVDAGGGQVMAQYATIKAMTSGRSADQQRLFDIVGMLAAYSVARQLLTGAPLAVPQRITDGKASIERFDTENFDKVRDGVTGTYGQLMRRLKAVLLVLVPTANVPVAATRTMISSVGLGADPVTGV